MPELVRLYIRHVLIGFAISTVFVAGLFYLNVGNLWHLVSSSDIGVMAALLLVVFNGIVFSGVQFAFAVMAMADKDPKNGGGRKASQGGDELSTVRISTRTPD